MKIRLLLATFFNVGRFPLAPGTLASLVTAAIFYAANYLFHLSIYTQIAAIVLLFLFGIPVAGKAEKDFGRQDPHQIVIDEVAGQMLSLLWLPLSIPLYGAGFLLFRFFDILKPFPVGAADRIHGGFGIMLDDIVAGLYALGVLHLLIALF
jgi:phosphatidylglycerophosphatase A